MQSIVFRSKKIVFSVLCADIMRIIWPGTHPSYLFIFPATSCIYPCFAVPPRFVNKVRNAYFVEGEDAQFTCTIEGAPRPQIRSVLQVTLEQILFSHFTWSEESPALSFQIMTLLLCVFHLKPTPMLVLSNPNIPEILSNLF